MSKFTDRLWADLAQEHGPALAQAERSESGRGRHPRVIAGGTLALAVAGTALGLGLTSAGGAQVAAGGSRVVTDAFTITQTNSGSVLVQVNQRESINAANAKLNAMIKEEVVVATAAGPAPVGGAVTCTPGEPNMHGPTVKVLLGADGTQVIAPGSGNTGVGTWHLTSCKVYPTADMGTGGTGTGAG